MSQAFRWQPPIPMTIPALLLAVLILFPVRLRGAEPGEAAVASRVMAAADKNHDGKLSLAEYLPLDVQAKHHGVEHFNGGDANRDGFLQEAELPAVLHKQTWFAILSEGINACFDRLDANRDGRLDLGEYRAISRMGGHAEQHFKAADGDQDGFLSRAEFTAHAEAKLKPLEAPVLAPPAPPK